ncbi:MAG TPA: type II toxin-antitoxin system VapC family toxin [Pseudomonadales bacterium]
MILVDTTIWIDHLRRGDHTLAACLDDGQVLMHPLILGELACGNLRNRAQLLALWRRLPQALLATDTEVLYFIEQWRLAGKGIGYVDAHLLTSVRISGASGIWTRDRRVADVAAALGCYVQPDDPGGHIHEP